MEGKAVDYKKIAYNEYMDSKDKSRFTSLAQKLAQHLNHLSEDKNSRIRWVWELIQNAKDVPNQFGKCKMRIEIRDDKLIFAHNGDPFRVSDLESLVAQYSSKAEENNVNTETTGKYGTGFITTYIVSRKVRIKGLLSMKTKEEMASADKQTVEEVKIGQEDEIGSQKFSEFEQEINEIKNKKGKQKNFQGGSLYQKFEIYLDRDYKDRDQELFYKLMRTQRNLLEDLLQNEPKPKWQRSEDDLNTQFIYEDLDEAAFKMITDAMICLKELFPYALLFNPKLSEIQMIDKREGKKLKNFGIKRMEPSKYNNIDIFNARILEQGKQARTFSIAYISDEETYSVLAMPVSVSEGLQLLEVNHNFPKMFKQFPLIGCKDHGFNFIFTSKQFYPNETRSDLLLSQIQGRNSKKSRANWEAIANIFNHGLQMYKTLSHSISTGQQNILVVSMKNQFTHEDHKQNRIDSQLQKFQKDLSQLKFIEFRSGRRGALNQLIFPLGKSEKNNCQHHDYSLQLNSLFAKLLGDNVTLADDTYKNLYTKLIAYNEVWKQFIQFKQVYDCLVKLNTVSFQNLAYILGDKESALNWLESLYDFLHKYNPSFMTQDKVTAPTDKNGLNFVLTNKMVFQDLKRTVKGSTLMIKQHLSQGYEEIALQIGISISEITIYDRFAKYFIKVKKFKVEEMLQLYRSVFYVQHHQGNPQYLVQLGRLLSTFKIKTEFMEVALKLKKLANADIAFTIKDPDFKLMMSDQQQKQYRYLFELKLMRYLNELLNTNDKLSKLLDETIFTASQKTKAIAWLNNIYRLEAKLIGESKYKEYQNIRPYCPKVDKKIQKGGLFGVAQEAMQKSLIQKGLSMSENFIDNSRLKQFCYFENDSWYQGNYPNDVDIKIYEKMRVIQNHNRQDSHNAKPYTYKLDLLGALREQITHPQITCKPAIVTTFTKMFGFIVPLYKLNDEDKRELNDVEKTELLNYIYDLRQAAIRDKSLAFKLEVFDELQKQAHYEYPHKAKSIKKKQEQVFAFHLMKNPKELQAAMHISQICGNLTQALIELKKYRQSQKKTA